MAQHDRFNKQLMGEFIQQLYYEAYPPYYSARGHVFKYNNVSILH